ncbi:Kinesin-like protein KIN-14I [Camellia lanceoleosa]|uniref:Kinesin-like protein KIN-14I n=1 Tax=Camellia lanceoleosa TaxID=1840588 RepID=A0ACC0F421_9ERIC|nr:Kinesin-like protein KIN-14I [Camellia lanceoleosa]
MVGVVGAKDLPAEPSKEEFRLGLRNSLILYNVLNKVQPGVVPKCSSSLSMLVRAILLDKKLEEVPTKKKTSKDMIVSLGNKSLLKHSSGDIQVEEKSFMQVKREECFHRNHVPDEESEKQFLKQKMIFEQQDRDIIELKQTLHTTKASMQFMQMKFHEDIHNIGLHIHGLACSASGYHKVLEENRKLYNQVQDLKDAGLVRVTSTSDVIDLMNLGQKNRVVGATAFNDRSSHSHRDLTSGAILHGCMHLVDLAGSERVDKSEAARDRLKEAQDINKSLFALGDVISSLAQKNSRAPYRNSKLTQLLQDSLEGALSFSVASVVKDVLQQHRIRSRELDLDSCRAEEAGANGVWKFGGNLKTVTSGKHFMRKNSKPFTGSLTRNLSMGEKSLNAITADLNSNNKCSSSLSMLVRAILLDKKPEEVPTLVESVLSKVVEEFEHRIASQTELKKKNSKDVIVSLVNKSLLKHGSDDIQFMQMKFHEDIHNVGSERVDKSEVTGDRLKEAQHINKSLSALGDVIFSLAQKNSHIPYRSSKLTQLLQDSLGRQDKRVMFVHISPKLDVVGETISTLKFAERVATVELGAACVNKNSADVEELKEQIASLKAALARKERPVETM